MAQLRKNRESALRAGEEDERGGRVIRCNMKQEEMGCSGIAVSFYLGGVDV